MCSAGVHVDGCLVCYNSVGGIVDKVARPDDVVLQAAVGLVVRFVVFLYLLLHGAFLLRHGIQDSLADVGVALAGNQYLGNGSIYAISLGTAGFEELELVFYVQDTVGLVDEVY